MIAGVLGVNTGVRTVMSFDPKNKADKAKLYSVLKALADLDPRKTPELIMDDAVGYPVARGQDYVRNMRRGEIATTYAALIHQWLLEYHFALAHRLAPEIFPETPEQRWQAIVDERAKFNSLKIVLLETEFGIARRSSQRREATTNIRFGALYCLELECQEEGTAILFQRVHGNWHNIEIGSDMATSANLKAGLNLLPQGLNGPDPLYEEEHEGIHDFVLVVSRETNIPTRINQLVDWIASHDYDLHKTSVQFAK